LTATTLPPASRAKAERERLRVACPPQPLRDLLEVLLGAFPELDLELSERAQRRAADENLDLVDRDLGQLGAVPRDAERRAPRPERGDLLDRPAAKHRAERSHDLQRRLFAAVDLELEPGALARQLQLPDALALLEPAAQRSRASVVSK
jgi:hypothetical protein